MGAGFEARHAAVKEILTDAHKQAQLVLAQKHVDKSIDFWKTVIFSDEKTFSLCPMGQLLYTGHKVHVSTPCMLRRGGEVITRVHKEASNCFFEKCMQQLSWLVRSPDLNPGN
ncbi:hypothetical protein J437_LFUL017356 [Ladona fulva]|uniref:Uncharacterized protein n=1 Tax=Ladona fulva TaxID=123851 RepID=A0A8K0KQL4_LADFU|nr:hypothetical protein J437_LFUL017356 [Ladona fulva]